MSSGKTELSNNTYKIVLNPEVTPRKIYSPFP